MQRLVLSLCLGLWASGLWAGEILINSALEKGDYALAFASAKADVKSGQATPAVKMLLAQFYMHGKGTEKNVAAARKLLEPLARSNAEARFLLGGMLKQEALQDLQDANGRVDSARYEALGKRSLKERENERYAAELIYSSALQGSTPAKEVVCADISNSVTALSGAERANWYRQCANREAWARASELGESLAPLNLRREVMRDPVVTEAFQRLATAAQCTNEDIKPVDFQISQPLSGAEYLQLKLNPSKPYTLIRGQWQETWTGEACGQRLSLPINFTADGMGGAQFVPAVSAEELASLRAAVKRSE